MSRRTATRELIRRVLKEDYLELRIARYALSEDLAAGQPARVAVDLVTGAESGLPVAIEGAGVGIVDALYSGMHAHYAREYGSLRTIKFTGFDVTGRMETGRDNRGADAEAVVSLTVENSEGLRFEFEEAHRSLVAASLKVVIDAIEYFINSERAFIAVYRALCDAKERRRIDLVSTFTAQLAELVNTTSYTEVIDRIKSETL